MVGEAAIVFTSGFRVAFDDTRMTKRYSTVVQNVKIPTTIILCVTEPNCNTANIDEHRFRTWTAVQLEDTGKFVLCTSLIH